MLHIGALWGRRPLALISRVGSFTAKMIRRKASKAEERALGVGQVSKPGWIWAFGELWVIVEKSANKTGKRTGGIEDDQG